MDSLGYTGIVKYQSCILTLGGCPRIEAVAYQWGHTNGVRLD